LAVRLTPRKPVVGVPPGIPAPEPGALLTAGAAALEGPHHPASAGFAMKAIKSKAAIAIAGFI
jgi:hypothetical protein